MSFLYIVTTVLGHNNNSIFKESFKFRGIFTDIEQAENCCSEIMNDHETKYSRAFINKVELNKKIQNDDPSEMCIEIFGSIGTFNWEEASIFTISRAVVIEKIQNEITVKLCRGTNMGEEVTIKHVDGIDPHLISYIKFYMPKLYEMMNEEKWNRLKTIDIMYLDTDDLHDQIDYRIGECDNHLYIKTNENIVSI